MDWRLITYGECDPAFNMAADEAILEAHLAGQVPPTLRLYGWKPAAISIGYSQKISPKEIQSIKDAGLDVVRRPTGGRAVLHLGDLTYSFVGTSIGDKDKDRAANEHQSNQNSVSMLPTSTDRSSPSSVSSPNIVQEGLQLQQGFLSTSVATAYKQICQGLIEAIKEFGIILELGTSNSDYRTNYDCFRATTNADLQYGGKKMIGSAQLRRKNAVLQHGSILLNQDQNKMAEVFGAAQEGDSNRHANLFEILTHDVSMSELEGAVQHGFEAAFAVKLIPSQLSNYEVELIQNIVPKYQILSTI
jgi:lipoate-protein ligase A